MSKEKIYCKDCRHSGIDKYREKNTGKDICYHSNNILKFKDFKNITYYFKYCSKIYFKKYASEINKNNDCDWFEKIK
jgi:hypothetical protein